MEQVRFHPLAEAELDDGIDFYKEIDDELAYAFQRNVEQALTTVIDDPARWRDRGGYRRCNLTRFPYYLPYIVRGNTIWILAIAHGSRKPKYWGKRIDELD